MLRFVILFLPTSYSLAVRPLVASKLLPPKARQAARLADVKSVALANIAVPCPRPIDIALGHSRPLWTI